MLTEAYATSGPDRQLTSALVGVTLGTEGVGSVVGVEVPCKPALVGATVGNTMDVAVGPAIVASGDGVGLVAGANMGKLQARSRPAIRSRPVSRRLLISLSYPIMPPILSFPPQIGNRVSSPIAQWGSFALRLM